MRHEEEKSLKDSALLARDDLKDPEDTPTEACPECGAEELRFDPPTGETDCVSCGWSKS